MRRVCGAWRRDMREGGKIWSSSSSSPSQNTRSVEVGAEGHEQLHVGELTVLGRVHDRKRVPKGEK